MMIVSMVRDYHTQHAIVNEGGWNIADAVQRSYDVEGMHIGTVAAGRIGLDALRKMKPFDVHLHYFDRHRLPEAVEQELNLTFHESVESMVKVCDVVTINCPLHPETENLFDAEMISKMKKGAYIVNTARGKICNREAIADALKSGQLSGYAGDVWFPQPAPNDHVWRSMPNHGMTPHTSGTSLSAQTRYADGVREILECFFAGTEIRNQYLIVQNGELAGMGATVTVKEQQQADQKKRQNIKSRSNMTDDRSEDLSYENEGMNRSTVTITLKEYDKLREQQKYITDRDLIGCIDKIEELVRALRKHIVRSDFE